MDLAELWLSCGLKKSLKSHVVVLRVLACASCNVTNVSFHRLLVTRIVFSMQSHQVIFRFVMLLLYLIVPQTIGMARHLSKRPSF